MVKKDITYVNQFTNKEVTETHYFNISKADLVEMEMEEHGSKYTAKDGSECTGMQAYLMRITDAEDAPEAYKWIKAILRRAYLKREGDRPVKSLEIWEDFEASEAYSEMVWGLVTDVDELTRFLQAVFPNNLEQIAAEVMEKAKAVEQPTPATVTPINGGPSASTPAQAEPPAAVVADGARLISKEEMTEMDPEELKSGLAEGRYKLS